MSIDVTITQKGIFKKTLPMETILGEKLKYGTFDAGGRLEEGKTSETDFTVFLPDAIARGFTVTWHPKEKGAVDLRLLTPTSETEIIEFYACVGRIMNYWNAELEVDGEKIKFAKWREGMDGFISFNERMLREICRSVIDGKHSVMTLFSAQFPLFIGMDEAKVFVRDITAFEDWMHEKQSMDVYYASPAFYRSKEGIFGMYVFTENCRSVFPAKPYVPFGFNDPETGKALECSDFRVTVCSTTEDKAIGEIGYDEFIAKLLPEKYSRFDGQNILIEWIDYDGIKRILE